MPVQRKSSISGSATSSRSSRGGNAAARAARGPDRCTRRSSAPTPRSSARRGCSGASGPRRSRPRASRRGRLMAGGTIARAQIVGRVMGPRRAPSAASRRPRRRRAASSRGRRARASRTRAARRCPPARARPRRRRSRPVTARMTSRARPRSFAFVGCTPTIRSPQVLPSRTIDARRDHVEHELLGGSGRQARGSAQDFVADRGIDRRGRPPRGPATGASQVSA